MSTVTGAKVIAVAFAMYVFASASLPVQLFGTWKIGKPYNTPLPIGIDARQDRLIRAAEIQYSKEALVVCGTRIPIKTVEQNLFSAEEFQQTYRFSPQLIGIKGSTVIEVTINSSDRIKNCGNEEGSVGAHLLFGKDGHVVMEVANAYFLLIKKK